MSKIYYLMGKSSTGKDTIYKELRKRMPQLKNVTIYTTRPRREGEKEGEEYFFTDETELEKFKTEGRLIEERAYNTVYGIWHYFTATPRIPPTSTVLKTASFNCNFTVEPQTFTTDLTIHLRSL